MVKEGEESVKMLDSMLVGKVDGEGFDWLVVMLVVIC